jgi:hypothetical protein
MPLSRLFLRTSIAAVSLAATSLGHAQSAEAEALFGEGARLMSEAKFALACEAFEASQQIEPRAGTLIRLGDCREKNRQLASAWSAYKDALTIVKDPRKREIAAARVAALEPRLSYLSIMIADDSRVDGLAITRNGGALDPVLWNRSVPVDGGDYVVAGRAPGHEEWSTTVIVPIEHGRISVEVPRFKDLKRLVAPAAVEPSEGATEDEVRRSSVRWTPRRRIAIGVGAGAVATAIGGVVLHVIGNRRERDAFALCPERYECANAAAANELARSGHRFAMGSRIAFGVGIAGVAAAGYLWLTGAPARRHITPVIAPDEASVVFVTPF